MEAWQEVERKGVWHWIHRSRGERAGDLGLGGGGQTQCLREPAQDCVLGWTKPGFGGGGSQ